MTLMQKVPDPGTGSWLPHLLSQDSAKSSKTALAVQLLYPEVLAQPEVSPRPSNSTQYAFLSTQGTGAMEAAGNVVCWSSGEGFCETKIIESLWLE